jgi:formylglycine-generating enzyme required for sulfatase activity
MNRFPWSNDWIKDAAVIQAVGPKPVGSTPTGNTPTGISDMIGNVAEWTSSKASIYEGNTKVGELPPAFASAYVIRGGSYFSQVNGPEPASVTARGFFAPDQKSPNVGFRLVKPAQ